MKWKKPISVMLAALALALLGVAVWQTVYHVQTDGHGHDEPPSHEGAIAHMLSWLGSFYSARPTVHPSGHEKAGDGQAAPAKEDQAGHGPNRGAGDGSQ